MKSKYSISEDLQEFYSDSARVASQGFELIDAKYANGVWVAAYGENIGRANTFFSTSDWNFEPTLQSFQARVAERKADGYDLTDVEYTPGGYWFGVFATNVGDSELIVAQDGADFDEQLLDLQDLDSSFSLEYQVLDIEAADGLWIGVANRTSGDATYTYSESFEEFEAEVQQQREDGIELSNVEYVGGDWYGVFTDELSGLSTYSPEFHDDLEDFTDEIQTYRSQGFDLINIESVDGDWFGIYKENVDGTDDIITPSDEEAIADPVGNTIQKIVLPGLMDAAFDI